MRFYSVILADIESDESDIKFQSFIEKRNIEWWRYTALNWILCTSDDVYTNQVLFKAVEAYGPRFVCVLEIKIEDVAGAFGFINTDLTDDGKPPFSPNDWFHRMKDPNFKKKWEK